MRELRLHERVQLGRARVAMAFANPAAHAARAAAGAVPLLSDELWAHSCNSLGIARLLYQEGRPDALVSTACRLAVETACRAALEQVGLDYNGDLERALARVGAPPDVWELQQTGPASRRLAGAERAVAWFASYLRHAAPGRSWGF